ncbi:hypothetical protein ACFQZI_00185 [Mucilaginibacter lutimaris]|uniref:Uncharacterized protein n=1 Tax=Mucilaginibacter lutimaris TaxID=931629 RepID=A0ABW2ZB65_9SPHI
MSTAITLGQFIIEKQADFPYAKGELSRILGRNKRFNASIMILEYFD